MAERRLTPRLGPDLTVTVLLDEWQDAPAGKLVLGPNTGISGRGNSSYLTFVGEPGR